MCVGVLVSVMGCRYGDAIDAGAKMLSDPDWYKQQGQQARALANQASAYFSYLTAGASPDAPWPRCAACWPRSARPAWGAHAPWHCFLPRPCEGAGCVPSGLSCMQRTA